LPFLTTPTHPSILHLKTYTPQTLTTYVSYH
jgi:hypothetical protein